MTNQPRGWEGATESDVASVLGQPTASRRGEKQGYVVRTYPNGAVVHFFQKKVKYFEGIPPHIAPPGHPKAAPKGAGAGVAVFVVLALVLGAGAYFFLGSEDERKPTIPPPTNGPTGRPRIGH
jgi:hypothetical protein